ncbi:cation-transporting P-type ATPase [Piscirickettsia litoralis]|uniref:cation-transporting P-type ATPase n=1 Tax=Piscirickettsia litoralis TaxID=1891921 RepID=UPI0009810D30|nr:cation-transporting P-type ATPase [Piscirickettsia litoralis]
MKKMVTETFKSDIETGLTDQQVEEYKKNYGPNLLTPRKGKSPLVRFFTPFSPAACLYFVSRWDCDFVFRGVCRF